MLDLRITQKYIFKIEKENRKLQSRIYNAIKYIKENMKEEYIHTDYIYTMIDILKGEER